MFIQSPAAPAWAGLTQPAVFDLDSTIIFRVSIVNNGQAFIDLDSTQTTLTLLTTPYTILLSGNSDTRISGGGDTTTLTFRATTISGISPADYAVSVNLVGTSTGESYSQTLNAGQVTIGGDVFFAGGTVTPNVALQGEDGILVLMVIGNNGTPLGIDSLNTKVIFKQAGVEIIPQPSLRRIDTLVTLERIPNNRLFFEFDVPQDFPLGEIEVFGRISLDGATLVKTSIQPIATFEVFGGSRIKYIANSLSEDQVVPRQNISFNITVTDSGTSGLTLIPSLSYLELGFMPILQSGLSANYVLPAGDSSTISFNPLVIPETVQIDTSFRFIARLVGVQVNGDTLTDTLDLEPLEILAPANVTLADIQIVRDVVRQGQPDVEIQYTLRNNGASEALVRNLAPRFTRLEDSLNVSSGWVLSDILPEFPDALASSESKTYTAKYVLAAKADTGIIAPKPRILYNDTRTANYVDTSYTTTVFDSVHVIQPASLRIDSLLLLADALAPNKPNVNINEPFNMRLLLSNLGADRAQNIYVTMLENGLAVTQFFFPEIVPNSQFVFDTNRSIVTAGDYNFVVRIDSAFDATTGALITVSQPLDNREDIHADSPVILNLQTRISGPPGALDSVVSVGQQFEIEAIVSNYGTASYKPGRLRLNVPANYSIITAADTMFSESDSIVNWQVRAVNVSPIGYDSLIVTLIDTSLDRNTDRPAGIGSVDELARVRSDSAASFIIEPAIVSPAGAIDGILSAGQTFTVRADITFKGNILDTARVAQILLPGGYAVTDSTVKILPAATNIISWNVIARNDTSSVQDSIRIRLTGIDGNSGMTIQKTSAAV
jgi:hypothetical protein